MCVRINYFISPSLNKQGKISNLLHYFFQSNDQNYNVTEYMSFIDNNSTYIHSNHDSLRVKKERNFFKDVLSNLKFDFSIVSDDFKGYSLINNFDNILNHTNLTSTIKKCPSLLITPSEGIANVTSFLLECNLDLIENNQNNKFSFYYKDGSNFVYLTKNTTSSKTSNKIEKEFSGTNQNEKIDVFCEVYDSLNNNILISINNLLIQSSDKIINTTDINLNFENIKNDEDLYYFSKTLASLASTKDYFLPKTEITKVPVVNLFLNKDDLCINRCFYNKACFSIYETASCICSYNQDSISINDTLVNNIITNLTSSSNSISLTNNNFTFGTLGFSDFSGIRCHLSQENVNFLSSNFDKLLKNITMINSTFSYLDTVQSKLTLSNMPMTKFRFKAIKELVKGISMYLDNQNIFDNIFIILEYFLSGSTLNLYDETLEIVDDLMNFYINKFNNERVINSIKNNLNRSEYRQSKLDERNYKKAYLISKNLINLKKSGLTSLTTEINKNITLGLSNVFDLTDVLSNDKFKFLNKKNYFSILLFPVSEKVNIDLKYGNYSLTNQGFNIHDNTILQYLEVVYPRDSVYSNKNYYLAYENGTLFNSSNLTFYNSLLEEIIKNNNKKTQDLKAVYKSNDFSLNLLSNNRLLQSNYINLDKLIWYSHVNYEVSPFLHDEVLNSNSSSKFSYNYLFHSNGKLIQIDKILTPVNHFLTFFTNDKQYLDFFNQNRSYFYPENLYNVDYSLFNTPKYIFQNGTVWDINVDERKRRFNVPYNITCNSFNFDENRLTKIKYLNVTNDGFIQCSSNTLEYVRAYYQYRDINLELESRFYFLWYPRLLKCTCNYFGNICFLINFVILIIFAVLAIIIQYIDSSETEKSGLISTIKRSVLKEKFKYMSDEEIDKKLKSLERIIKDDIILISNNKDNDNKDDDFNMKNFKIVDDDLDKEEKELELLKLKNENEKNNKDSKRKVKSSRKDKSELGLVENNSRISKSIIADNVKQTNNYTNNNNNSNNLHEKEMIKFNDGLLKVGFPNDNNEKNDDNNLNTEDRLKENTSATDSDTNRITNNYVKTNDDNNNKAKVRFKEEVINDKNKFDEKEQNEENSENKNEMDGEEKEKESVNSKIKKFNKNLEELDNKENLQYSTEDSFSKCGLFRYHLYLRHTYISPFLKESYFNPRIKKIFILFLYLNTIFMILCLILTIDDSLIILNLSSIGSLNIIGYLKLPGYAILSVFLANLIIIAFIYLMVISNEKTGDIYAEIIKEKSLQIMRIVDITKRNMTKNIILGFIVIFLVSLFNFYFLIGFCSVWAELRLTVIGLYIISIFLDFIFEIILESIILWSYYASCKCCKTIYDFSSKYRFFRAMT